MPDGARCRATVFLFLLANLSSRLPAPRGAGNDVTSLSPNGELIVACNTQPTNAKSDSSVQRGVVRRSLDPYVDTRVRGSGRDVCQDLAKRKRRPRGVASAQRSPFLLGDDKEQDKGDNVTSEHRLRELSPFGEIGAQTITNKRTSQLKTSRARPRS